MAEVITTVEALGEAGLADLVEAAQAALTATFGSRFDFWLHEGGAGPWTPLAAEDEPAARGQTAPGPDEPASVHLDESIGRPLLSASGPVLVEHAGGRIVLGVPLAESGGYRLAATTVLSDSAGELALRLARLFVADFGLKRQLDRSREELDLCAAQIGSDFEELAFLRRLADHLDMSDVSHGTWHVAQMVLPLLAAVVQAESLVLVTAKAESEAGLPGEVDRAVVWFGPRPLDDEACRRLVEKYRAAAMDQPLVKNHLHAAPEGTEFPGVRKFVMVSMVKGRRVLGWLVAINHARQHDVGAERSLWALSQFEFGTVEAGLLSSVASMLATHAHNVELFCEKEALLVSVVRAMVSAVDAKDPYTCGHSERVALVAKHLGKVLRLDETECERLYLAGLLHDLGKLGVPDAVLRKTTGLTEEEMAQIRPHPERGWAILQDLDALNYLTPGVLHHHERYDGRGYPDGLAGSAIPLPARILAVADSYDAMASDRPYRRGMPLGQVEQILRAGAGAQWDPEVVAACLRTFPTIRTLWQNYQPQATRVRCPSPTTEEGRGNAFAAF